MPKNSFLRGILKDVTPQAVDQLIIDKMEAKKNKNQELNELRETFNKTKSPIFKKQEVTVSVPRGRRQRFWGSLKIKQENFLIILSFMRRPSSGKNITEK